MASGFSSAPNLAAAVALSFILLANARTLSPAPPPLPANRKEMAYLLLTFTAAIFVFMIVTLAYLICKPGGGGGPKRTVLKVQVVLSARAGDIGRALRDIIVNTNRPAESITESTKTVLRETINALLAHQSSFIYGSTSVKPWNGIGTKFATGPLEGMVRKEARKMRIEREYVRNCGYVPKLAPKQDKDYAVVMIMVLAEGDHELPRVGSSVDVKEALNYLETKISRIRDVEVMWAYQDPLLILELLDFYPNLNSILA